MKMSPTHQSIFLGHGVDRGGRPPSLGLASGAPPADSGEIEEIRWALASIPQTLFIPRGWSTSLGAIMSLVQEGPLSYGNDLSLVPAAADRWEQVDPVTYRYHLRQGVTFSDGSALTPEDVIASARLYLDSKSGSRLTAFYDSVATIVTAVGPDEGDRRNAEATERALSRYAAATMAGLIFKKSQLEAHPEDISSPARPWSDRHRSLSAISPNSCRAIMWCWRPMRTYWGTKPTAKRIIFRAIPESPGAAAGHRRRARSTANFGDISLSDIDRVEGADECRHRHRTPSLGIYCLTLDQSAPPFDDIHVRRAVVPMLLDRAGLW